jgi:hypothetical protein
VTAALGGRSAEQAGHELLLALAGRLPDGVLWRLRDWLAAGATAPVGAVLARELLRGRVGLTDAECDLLAASAGRWGAPTRLLEAVLPLDGPPTTDAVFRPAPDADTAALSALAVVRGHPGAVDLRQAVRTGPGPEQRVLLVHGGAAPWTLTGTIQRVLRAHGDRTPCVEVLPAHGERSAYHRAVIIGAASLWTAADTVPA